MYDCHVGEFMKEVELQTVSVAHNHLNKIPPKVGAHK